MSSIDQRATGDLDTTVLSTSITYSLDTNLRDKITWQLGACVHDLKVIGLSPSRGILLIKWALHAYAQRWRLRPTENKTGVEHRGLGDLHRF